MKEELYDAYGFIFEEELLQEMVQCGVTRQVKQGDAILELDDYVKSIPLLIDGAIKVSRINEEGRELLLYFLERGDTCAITLNCCLSGARSEVQAVAERDTNLLMIPVEKMDDWIIRYKSWRKFIFESYHVRMREMLDAIDTVSFLKMDQRLLLYLRDKAKVNQSEIIQTTHQEIAQDLDTSRVVISRLLKALEHQGSIKMGRNWIEVIDL